VCEDLAARKGVKCDALEIDGGTLAVMCKRDGLVMDLETAYSALLGAG
jgi:hypothetical protein